MITETIEHFQSCCVILHSPLAKYVERRRGKRGWVKSGEKIVLYLDSGCGYTNLPR